MTPCHAITISEGGVCEVHGAAWSAEGCTTAVVLADVAQHRWWQFSHHGSNRHVPDGTGPDVAWIPSVHLPATEIEQVFRDDWDWPKDGTDQEKADAYAAMTWMRLLREEVAESFAKDNPDELYGELVQVAALAVSWAEKIRERQQWQYGERHEDGYVFGLPYWSSPDMVIAAQHGLRPNGSTVDVVRRRPGGDWEEMPSWNGSQSSR